MIAVPAWMEKVRKAKERKEKRLIKSKEIGTFREKVKTVSKKTERKRLINELDKAFSLYIRARDRKVRGGLCIFDWCANKIENCFHWITRSKYSVRWDASNAVGSCSKCNYSMEFNPHPYISWYIHKYGVPAHDGLVRRSNIIHKHSNDDLRAILSDIYKMTEALK